MPPAHPGRGTIDYPGHVEGDVPKAYAMVLLAELERLGRPGRADQANLARTAGEWLLTNADSNGDGIIGWGLPVAWDAYDDGSTNPPDTEYTISTAIVIDALLTWAERDPEAPRPRIRQVVQAAIAPYLEARFASPTGMAPYSLAAADRRYDTFNPAAYLAGQMQRASMGVDQAALRQRYQAAADASMRVLLAQRRLAQGSGHWYWHYSVQQALPNDLPHAGYMIEGVRAYIEHGGRLAEHFDWPAVLGHLADFRGAADPGSEVRAFPSFYPELKLPARSYDLGIALHLACSDPRLAPLVPGLMGAVGRYRTAAARYLKYPAGTSSGGGASEPALVINEYEAYLYRGLTRCALVATTPTARPSPSATAAVTPLVASPHTALHARRLMGRPAAPGDLVPLLPSEAGLVSFDALARAQITRSDGLRLALSEAGVPVRVLEQGETTYVFHRRHPDDRLTLLRYERQRLTCRLELSHGDDPTAVPMLRAAVLAGTRLHAVIYHNPSQANWHSDWDVGKGSGGACPRPAGGPHALPSLGEPAGSTYEMVPALHFHLDRATLPTAGGATPVRLWLAGGNVQMLIGEAGPDAITRIPGCWHVVESTVTPRGLAHLCIAAPTDATTAAPPLVVVAPAGLLTPALDTTHGVPWNLRWSLGALQIDHAAGPRALRHLLRRDLARTAPGGWLEFGINNDEGRIPWSQIYYLNGLLDLLDLAQRDVHALELFGPLLGEVRRRLDMEMRLLDAHVAAGRHATRAFTVDRSRALFGVQTGRFLLVMHRYRTEVPEALPMASYERLRGAVQQLEGHIEVLATEGEDPRWIEPGRHHLRWPKGSAFAFDGLAVPFNHQNEWAHAVLATAEAGTPEAVRRAATDVLQHFVDRIAPAAELPAAGVWDYWWGRAYDGWDGRAERHRPSVNTPRYGGDRIKAWISFRTIDAMALVSGAAALGEKEEQAARRSAASLVERGLLYPFANHVLVQRDGAIHLSPRVAQEYARVSAPWELSNAVWALAVLSAQRR